MEKEAEGQESFDDLFSLLDVSHLEKFVSEIMTDIVNSGNNIDRKKRKLLFHASNAYNIQTSVMNNSSTERTSKDLEVTKGSRF